ncbi:MAG: OadG family transporter subunit [Candidatus Izemoplasmatales bacterium]|nr:OadG family transporter subunit [Candidatus Izemoplasmatales bacterium]
MMLNYNFFEGVEISLFSILIVFLLLGFVALSISWLKYIVVENKPKEDLINKTSQKPISIADIKDEDMMVAALVASIDYYTEINKDVRVTSIREITE